VRAFGKLTYGLFVLVAEPAALTAAIINAGVALSSLRALRCAHRSKLTMIKMPGQ
jgi:hypothetical protein